MLTLSTANAKKRVDREMKKATDKNNWFNKPSTKIIMMTELVVFVSISILCFVSVLNVRAGINKAIRQRMLDIANCASGSVNGDVLEKLTAEDSDTPEYRSIYDQLAIFRDNVELEYVYGIKDEGNGHFTFTVDPAIDAPAPFGGDVEYTEALAASAKGMAAVDETPYTDAWGTFYSAYSPVFDSSGKVAGISAVDFSQEWFESQLASQTQQTVVSFVILLAVILIIAGVLSMVSVAPFVRRMVQLSEAVEKNASEKLAAPFTGHTGSGRRYRRKGHIHQGSFKARCGIRQDDRRALRVFRGRAEQDIHDGSAARRREDRRAGSDHQQAVPPDR